MALVLSSQSDPPRQGLELQCRWKTLKSDFYDYKHCVDKTGWGWDPEKRVPIAPEESCWEELRKHNQKLYKCKSKAFIWYDIMNDLCGSNIANGFFVAGKVGESLQELVSLYDSSVDTDQTTYNQTAEQEVNDFDLHSFRNTLDVDSNVFVVSDNDTPLEQSPEVALGNAYGSTSGKRVREASVGVECGEPSQDKKSKKESNSKSKKLEYHSVVKMIVEESRERRVLLEKLKNKSNEVADKLLRVKGERNMTMEQLSMLQDALTTELSQALFMSMEGDVLYEWIDKRIEVVNLRRGS